MIYRVSDYAQDISQKRLKIPMEHNTFNQKSFVALFRKGMDQSELKKIKLNNNISNIGIDKMFKIQTCFNRIRYE